MNKKQFKGGSLSTKRRLLHLVVTVIFFFNSIVAPVVGGEILQNNPLNEQIISEQAVSEQVYETEFVNENAITGYEEEFPLQIFTSLATSSVTNLTATPNVENNAIVLNWENPTENFDYAFVERWEDYGEWSGWNYLGDTANNTYTHTDVTYYQTYRYRVTAVDLEGNWDTDPPEITTGLISDQPIILVGWDLDNEGRVNFNYVDSYGISANFMASEVIISIEYEISTDNMNWTPIPAEMINYDYGLDFSSWRNEWSRYFYLDFTDIESDVIHIRATATDSDDFTVTNTTELSIDLVCEDATDFTAVPNGDNTGIELSWSVPEDFDYGYLYKEYYYYGWKWGYEARVTGTNYTDTDIDTENLYKTYRYKLILYDKHGNESQSPPIITGNLVTPGPIALEDWYLYTNDGRINQQNASSYYISASFYSLKPITQIQYNYSFDGETWANLAPFISTDHGLAQDQTNFSAYRGIAMNIGQLSGIPDGNFHVQAVCTDEDGNTLTAERLLVKDATPPQNVSNITSAPNDDNTAIVLTWTNPPTDMKYLTIERDSTYITPVNFNLETFTDSNVKSGQEYTYKFTVYDDFGNRSANPPTINGVISTELPVLDTMSPANNFLTKNATLPYAATFRSSITVNRVVFEVSKDGLTWDLLKTGVPTKNYSGYYLSGSWDISWILEEEWLIRATAYDTAGGTASETRTVFIDHQAPAPPGSITPEITSLSPNTITLHWDEVAGADSYLLSRYYVNPDDGAYPTQITVNPPTQSYVWSSGLYAEKPYRFTIQSVDKAGNKSEEVSCNIEIFTGPEVMLDEGYDVHTNQSNYTVRGTTTSGATITVNGNAAPVDAEGKFSYNLTLTTTDNSLTIIATKDALTHTVKQKVTYDTVAPTISTFSPYDNAVLQGKQASIYISTSDNIYRSIARQVLQVSKDDGASWIDVLEISFGQTNVYWDTTADVGGEGPLADGAYKFRLMIWDRAGNSSSGNIVRIWKIDNTKPDAPTGLTAVQEIGKVKLTWVASIAADLKTSSQYKISRSLDSGSRYEMIGYASNTSYEDVNILEGVTYYYVVTAIDVPGNESEFSNEVSSSALNDTTAPIFKSVPANGGTYGGTQISNYLTASDNSPNGVDKFKLEYSHDNGTTWKSFTQGASSRTVSGSKEYYTTFYLPTSGMVSGAYIFRYSALDYAGNTAVQERNMTIDLTVNPVQNLTARSGEGSVILEWNLSEDTDISSYQIQRSTYFSGGYFTLTTLYNNTAQTYIDSNVVIDKTYYYKVVSRDAYANEAATGVVSAVPSDDITAPQITAVNIAQGALTGGKTISLTVSATDNKLPTAIEFSGSQDGGTTWTALQTSFVSKYSNDNITFQFTYNWSTTGLHSGEIIVKMTGKDAAGNAGSLERTWHLDLSVTPPTNLRTTPGDGSILIQWDDVGDEDLSSYPYEVLRAAQAGGPYIARSNYLNKTTTQYTDTGLQTGTTYYYVVKSRDTFGNEALSSEVAASPAGDEIPPFIDSVSPANGTTIGGSVDQELKVYASDNAGRVGSRGEIEYSTDNGTTWLPVNQTITGPTDYNGTLFSFKCFWDLKDLSSGNYQVRYTVYDAAGNSSYQSVDYAVDRTPPSPPKNLFATYGELSIGLVWDIPSEADVIGYKVYRANTLDGNYEKIKDINGKESNIYADNTVQQGLTYFYRVTAIDTFYQEGEASNIASAAAVADSFPPKVTWIQPDHHAVLGATALITVTAEDNVALSSITLEYNMGSGWIPIDTLATIGTAVFKWSTKPLLGNVQIRAIAKDSAGNVSDIDDGDAFRAYTIDNIGPHVTGLKGTSYGGDIVLEWDNVLDRDFAYFLVEKKDDLGRYQEVKKVYNVLGINMTNLEASTDYWFRVTAFDKMGNPGDPAEIMVNSGADQIAPVATYEYSYHKVYSGNQSILINPFTATDNVGVKKLITQYSADGINWSEINNRVLDVPVRSIRVNEIWDVSVLPDGDYYVRVIAEDEVGNVSQPSDEGIYWIDHINPTPPHSLSLSSTAGYIDISWQYKAERDFWHFKLWKAEAESGPYEQIPLGTYQHLRYLDRSVESGKTYYYKVTVLDVANNESGFSQIISGNLTEDTNPPYIYLDNPLAGDILNSRPLIGVTFVDDLALKTMSIKYRGMDPTDEWGTVLTKDYDPDNLKKVSYFEEKYFWDNRALPEGWYDLSYTITDSAGNVTGPLIMRHLINNVPPEAPVLSAEPGGWQVALNWDSNNQVEDFSRYVVYRTNILGGTFRGCTSTPEKSFVDGGVQPGIRYYYYVRAYDVYGNYSQSETVSVVPTNADLILPLAHAGDDHVLTVGLEAYFDGTLSRDNDRIASYQWDFGDGETAVTAQPIHSYSAPGTYPVTLTVSDPAGNRATDTALVRVVSADEAGILEVKVIDDVTGELLPGASIVIDFPDGASQKMTTNSVGTAFVVAPPGNYQVFAFKTDYKPASIHVTMIRGQRSTGMIRLPKGSVVTGELKAERMTLDEIIAAGLDINDPDNRQAYKFEIGLGFNIPGPIISTKGKFIRPTNSTLNITVSDDGTRIYIREKEKEENGEGDGGRIFMGEQLLLPEKAPAMAYMVIPGKTTWLKEFFDIGFTVQNAADPEYVIENAWTKLTLPDGLSLAPTREAQHLYIEMGSIAGGDTNSVNWIVRGDEKGEYRLAAEFNGLLMPFGDEIKQVFRNDEPFRVWAGDALNMHIVAQDRSDKGYPYNLRIGIENISDGPVYDVTLELLEETKQNYLYAPNQKLLETITELAPGATLWKDYQLIPITDGELSLGQSFVLKTGGTADIENKLTSLSVPENVPGTAPLLNQENKGDKTVSLSWGSIEGALGYKIYKVREDLMISLESELVYTCGPEVLSVDLDEPNGPMDYVIKTVTGEGEIMRHGITGFSWMENAGKPTLTIDPEQLIVGREKELLITARKGGFPLEFGRVVIEELGVTGSFDDEGQSKILVKPEEEGPITIKLYEGSELLLEKTIQAVLPKAPAQPMGLRGEAVDRKVVLTWFPNSELELAGYYVYQIKNNSWIKINTGMLQGTTFQATGLNDNATYTFQVSALDTFDRESILSHPVQVDVGIPEDQVEPWIIKTTPANQGENVPLNTEVKVFFSENIALHRAFEEIQVKIGGQMVAFDPVTAGNVLTITLYEVLPLKTHCEVIIPVGAVRDINFNELSSEYKLDFFTGAEADSKSPVLVGVSPGENTQGVSVHSTITLYFSEEIFGGTAYEAITLTADENPVPHSKELVGHKIILKPLAILPYSSKIEITIPEAAVVDGSGNELLASHLVKFYTDTVPDSGAPQIVSMMPSANSEGVPLNGEINIYFSEKIKVGENFSGITLKTGDQFVAAIVTVSGNLLLIKPSENLTANKLYRVDLPAGAVADLSGNPLLENYAASFITGDITDNVVPTLLSTVPGPGTGEVSVASSILISFSEQIQPGENFDDIMFTASGILIDFEVNLSEDGLTLIPLGKLPEGADCQVTIPIGALKDVAGNSLTEEGEMWFTTAVNEGDGAIDECFIATAAFGSKLEPSVTLLRSFRDDFLLTSGIGKAFVQFYYKHSPAVAQFIAGNEFLRAATRLALLPMIFIVYFLYHPMLLLLLIPLISWALKRKKRRSGIQLIGGDLT